MKFPIAAVALAMALLHPLAHADGALEVTEPWARATPPGARVGGGFMMLSNTSDETVTLVGGSATFAGRVEVHSMEMDGEVMRMRELKDGLSIPAGESVILQPGGFHLMFMELKETLQEGERRSVTLNFLDDTSMDVELVVNAVDASMSGMGHGMKPDQGMNHQQDMKNGHNMEGDHKMQHGEGMSHQKHMDNSDQQGAVQQ